MVCLACVLQGAASPDASTMDQVAVMHLAESVKVAKLLQQWKSRAAQVRHHTAEQTRTDQWQTGWIGKNKIASPFIK